MTTDIVLRDGRVFKGVDMHEVITDVLIRDGRIVALDNIPQSAQFEEIDCSGLVVAPGFIDAHSHSDQEILHHETNKISQGVTTEIAGNCGFSLFPSRPNPDGIKLTGELFDGEPPEGMANTAEYFNAVHRAGSLVNVAVLTGHIPVRIQAMQMRRAVPTREEMTHMETLLEACLASGSLGFSTGLNCMPSGFADIEEIKSLCRIVRRYQGWYATHMRDYKFRLVEAVEESLAVARSTQVPLQISHLQAVGKRCWPLLDVALERIEDARRKEVDVAFDAYPYLAGSASLIQFLPEWCQDGGTPALLDRLGSTASYSRIAAETDDYMSNTWDDLIVAQVKQAKNRTLIGKSIAKIAAERDRSAPETALDLLAEEEGSLWIISFNNSEENLRKILAHPLAMVITDGLLVEGATHPRSFGTFPKFLGEYVREKEWLPLGEALKKTSTLAAQRFGFKDRGTLEPGKCADVVVFDEATIGSDADYVQPTQNPSGIVHVLVNGHFAMRNGGLTGRCAGVALTRDV